MTIAERVDRVRKQVRAACERSGRDPSAVTLVAVSKGRPASEVEEVVRAGVRDVGENRARELHSKASDIGLDVRWHFVGPLQTNKVRYLDAASLVHGVQRVEEAEALHRRGEKLGRAYDVLVEVNVAGEPSKQGIAPDELPGFVRALSSYDRIRARGLMMMAPMAQTPEDVRWVFAEARRLRDRVRPDGLEELSMGMTDDFEVAIEEGATLVRIGRAIFGREDI